MLGLCLEVMQDLHGKRSYVCENIHMNHPNNDNNEYDILSQFKHLFDIYLFIFKLSICFFLSLVMNQI